MKDSVNTLFRQRFQGHEAAVDPGGQQRGRRGQGREHRQEVARVAGAPAGGLPANPG